MTKDAISLDLETLGTTPGDVIVSIGAVRFDPTVGIQSYDDLAKDSIKLSIEVSNSLAQGFKINGDALTWWLNQSKEAQAATFVKTGLSSAGGACMDLLDWMNGFGVLGSLPLDRYKIWSNGANFDAPMMEAYYKELGLSIPWKYSNVRCYRTLLKTFDYNQFNVPVNTLKHDCLADAIYQAQVIQAVVEYNPNLKTRISK
jgi:hypothetical protein